MALDLRPERYGSKALAKGAEMTGAEILSRVKPVTPTVQTSGRNPGGKVAVNDWMSRYNRVMDGVSRYDEKRNGGFTRDASGGYLGNINSLIADYENIRDVADQFGFRDSQKYLDQLKQLQTDIGQINDSFSQFDDEEEFSRYMDFLNNQDEMRTASLKDLTWNSLKRGYYNSLYGEESFKAMNREQNQKEAYEKILAGEDYQFAPGNDFAGAVSGAMEQIGQQARQFTHPRTVAAVGAAGIGAFALGQAGPQVLAPEEVITVPGAMAAAFKAGSAASNLEIEAGHAYNEMLEKGISEETARKVAWGVGGVNAGLELLQVDELLDAYKVTKASGATKTVAQKIFDELLERGVGVAKETAQEVVQEGVTITGVQAASKKDTGEYAYGFDEVKSRLKDTSKSSALTFGLMNVPATAKNTASIAAEHRKEGIANARNTTVKDTLTTELANNATETVDNTTEPFDNTTEPFDNATPALEKSTPGGATEESSAADNKMSATEAVAKNETTTVGVSKMETVEMTEDLDSFAKQFGKQAEAVKRNYMDGQDVQEYELGFQTAYAVGLEGGRKENLKNVPYLSESQKDIAFSMGRDAAAQKAVIVEAGILEARHYGEQGYTMDQLAKHGADAAALTEDQRKAAWEEGRQTYLRKGKATPAASTGESGVWFDNGGGDVVDFADYDVSGVSETAMAGVRAAQMLQKLGIGGKFYFFESYVNEAGNRVYKDSDGVEKEAPNGWYDPDDGSIHIDLNAGRDANGLTLYTLSHELTHHLERQNIQGYRRLAEFLVANYAEHGNVDAMVFEKQVELNRNRRNREKPVSYETAYSEFIADSMEAMLSDGNVLEKLQEMQKTDRSLWEAIKEFFDSIAEKIRNAYKDLKPDSAEGRAVLEMKDQIEQIQQLFAEALNETAAKDSRVQEKKTAAKAEKPAAQETKVASRETAPVATVAKKETVAEKVVEPEVRQESWEERAARYEADRQTMPKKLKMAYESHLKTGFGAAPKVEKKALRDPKSIAWIKERGLDTDGGFNLYDSIETGQYTIPGTARYAESTKQEKVQEETVVEPVTKTVAEEATVPEVRQEETVQESADEAVAEEADVTVAETVSEEAASEETRKEKKEDLTEQALLQQIQNAEAEEARLKSETYSKEVQKRLWDNFENIRYLRRELEKHRYGIEHGISDATELDISFQIHEIERVKGLKGQFITAVLNDLKDDLRTYIRARETGKEVKAWLRYAPDMTPEHKKFFEETQVTVMGADGKKPALVSQGTIPGKFAAAGNASLTLYTDKYDAFGAAGQEKGFVNITNAYIVDAKYQELGKLDLDEIIRKAQEEKVVRLDGVIIKNVNDETGKGAANVYIAFEANRFRTVDEVTYSAGYQAAENVGLAVDAATEPEQIKSSTENIGTFDGLNPDIRYQDRASGTSDRELLAGALEGLTRNSTEYEFVQEYRENARELDAQEAKLQDLRRQIRELTFGKGPKDPKRLAQLQEEATKTGNRINIYDKKLLELEATVPLKRVLERERQKVKQKADANKKAAVARVREETRAAIEGAKSESEIMEREFLRLMRAYEKLSSDSAEKAKKAKKAIDKKQDTIDSYKSDLATMEREFLRVMKGYETAERKTNAFWEGEFKRLMREYEASGRKVDRLEAKLKAQRESIRSNVDSRRRTVLRNKIRKDIRELDKILNKGNKKRNVKQGMQDFVAKAIATGEILFADLDSDTDLIASGIQADMTADERKLLTEAERYVRQITELEGNEAMADVLEARRRGLDEVLKQLQPVLQRERIRINSADASSAFDALVASYESLQESPDAHIAAAFNPEALEYLKSVKHKFAGTLVKDMSQEQLQTLHKCYKMVMTMIRDANKAFVDGRSVQADAEQMVQEFQERKIPEKKVGIILRNLSNAVGWNYEKLYYALERINSPTLKRLYQNLADSENITMQDVQEAKAFQMEMVEKYHYNDWKIDQKMERTFLDNNGKEFHLTLGELMALYAYSRREGADRHIEVGGFTFGKTALTNSKPAETYKLTADQIAAISNLLTPEQKSFAEGMQRYLSRTMGAKGNEVSMKLYGIEMFGEEDYFPLHIAGEYKARAQESQAKAEAGFQSMTNAGFTKARNANATAPIVLEDFMTVWVDHVNEMSRYHGAVPALEDIRRVMNYSVYSDAMADSVSVQAAMTNAYGKQAVQYFDSLYREANSGAVTDKMDATSKKMLSAFRKNSVAYSASVVIQQPASIYRAKAVVDSKYFGKHGLFTLTGGVLRIFNRKKWNSAYADMMQYAPGVTMAKEIGGFDTSSGGSIRSYLLDTDRGFKQSMKNGTAAQKAGALLNVVDDNVIANLPNVADKIAWIEIWEACRRETVANNPKLATSSEEFKQKVGQRFTEVIRATQVYDSMFSKSPMLKSKNLAVQYVVSFMNEPNTVANMAEKALRDVLQGNVKTAGKAIGALATSIVVTNLLKSIIYAIRDEDDDETFMEKYLSAVAGNLTSDVNPLNYIPYARDIWSIWQGYDVERADMAVIADAVNAIRKLQKLNEEDVAKMSEEELEAWDKKVMDAQWRVAETLSPIAGIPLKNIRREVLAAINAVKIRELDKTRESTELSIRHAIEEAIGMSERSEREKLYEAIVAKDKAYADRLKAGYETDESYHSAIKLALRDHDSRIWEAAAAWNNNDLQGYMALAREIIAEGNFIQDDVVLAIRSEASAMEESQSASSSTVKGYFTNEKFGVALGQNNTSMADIIQKDLIDTKIANGKTRSEAEKAVENTARSQLKELFETGEITGTVAQNMLVRYGGYDREEAADLVAEWKYETEHPELDGRITYSQYQRWEADGKRRGISLESFTKVVEFRGGNTSDGVRSQEDVAAYINSMPISTAQKDALWCCFWSEKTLYKNAPWH